MTVVRDTPNIEALVGYILRTALSIDVSSGLKKDPTYPAIVVTRFGGTHPTKRSLDRPNIQCEVYGVTKVDAFDAAVDARREMLLMEGQTYTSPVAAVIGEVTDSLGLQFLQDPLTGRDRYIFAMTLVCHI